MITDLYEPRLGTKAQLSWPWKKPLQPARTADGLVKSIDIATRGKTSDTSMISRVGNLLSSEEKASVPAHPALRCS